MRSVSPVPRLWRIRSSKGKWEVSLPCFPIGALPRQMPPRRLCCDILRREIAITRLDWSFAPSPRSKDRIARQNPFRPPPGFRPASPCPGLDRLVSILTAMTPSPFRLRPSRVTPLWACRFPFASGLRALRLAMTVNSPASASRLNARPWSSTLVQPHRYGFLRVDSTLSGRARL